MKYSEVHDLKIHRSQMNVFMEFEIIIHYKWNVPGEQFFLFLIKKFCVKLNFS